MLRARLLRGGHPRARTLPGALWGYEQLDDEALPLAVENTNVKAQRLSFGLGREAADAFRSAIDRIVGNMRGHVRWELVAEADAATAPSQ